MVREVRTQVVDHGQTRRTLFGHEFVPFLEIPLPVIVVASTTSQPSKQMQ
jgi:hypothetical protein